MAIESKKRGRPQKTKQSLNDVLIVNTAKNLMKTDKKIPSIRQLATSLNVDAMAIYYYFKNKNALLEAITTSLISDVYDPFADSSAGETENWQAELTKLAKSYLSILHEYDGLLETLLKMGAESPAHVFISRFNQILTPLALSKITQKTFLDVFVDYLHGFSIALKMDDTGTLTLDDAQPSLNFLYQGVGMEINR